MELMQGVTDGYTIGLAYETLLSLHGVTGLMVLKALKIDSAVPVIIVPQLTNRRRAGDVLKLQRRMMKVKPHF